MPPKTSRTSNAREKKLTDASDFEAEMPDAAFNNARNEFYGSMGQPVVDKARLFAVCIVLLLVIIGLVIALINMLPLKTTEPYVVYVDSARGVVAADQNNVKRAADYTPDRPVIERELFQFVERLYAINADYPAGVQDGHVAAYAYTRGRAITEFKEFMDREQPYQRQKTTKGLIRTLEKNTVSFQQDGKLVLIRFRSSERTVERPVPVVRDWLITIQFVREQPTAKAELDKNPLGIYVTHFEVVEER